MTTRMLLEEEKGAAWDDLFEWGYPTPSDMFPHVVMMSVDGVAYVWYEWLNDKHILMHMGAHPEHRGRWLTNSNIKKIRYSWEFLGAERVYVVTSNDEVNDLAARQGFIHDELGYYWEI